MLKMLKKLRPKYMTVKTNFTNKQINVSKEQFNYIDYMYSIIQGVS